MTSTAATTALGLGAAIVWGAGDFSGGMAARHLRVSWLIAISHGFSLSTLLALALLLQPQLPSAHTLGWGIAAGLAGGVALLAFYRALALGEMGITASISGLLTAAVPVLFTYVTVGPPDARQLAGFGFAVAAIWLISGNSSKNNDAPAHPCTKLMLAVVAGLGFGAFLIAIRQANAGGLLWPLAAARVASCSLALATGFLMDRDGIRANPGSGAIRPWPSAVLGTGLAIALVAGALDTGGNLFFLAATSVGRLDVAAVLSSLYPASTILLAAWILQERPAVRQALGMATALLAVALIS